METTFPGLLDVNHQNRLIADWCRQFYPLIPYKQLVIPVDSVDKVHDELPEYEKQWRNSVNLRAYAEPADQAFPLTVFGIEELRDVVLHVSVPDLVAAELATQDPDTKLVTLIAKPGDRFTYTYEYEILAWKIEKTFASTDIPLIFAANAEKVRRDAAAYQGL